MIISVADSGVVLEDPHNFRAFKVVVNRPGADLAAIQSALAGLATLPDRETAWVSEVALRRRPEVATDAAWQQACSGMIEKAKAYGWIDEQNKTIKAHIEWPA